MHVDHFLTLDVYVEMKWLSVSRHIHSRNASRSLAGTFCFLPYTVLMQEYCLLELCIGKDEQYRKQVRQRLKAELPFSRRKWKQASANHAYGMSSVLHNMQRWGLYQCHFPNGRGCCVFLKSVKRIKGQRSKMWRLLFWYCYFVFKRRTDVLCCIDRKRFEICG